MVKYMGGAKAFGKHMPINRNFTVIRKKFMLALTLKRKDFEDFILGKAKAFALLRSEKIKTKGRILKLKELFGLMDRYTPVFPIATHD